MEEKLYFKNSKGDTLCGILSNPTNDNQKAIIVLCHGFSSSKNSKTYVRLQEILNKDDIATFRFDFYGHGESEGKFEDITISEAVDDALCGIKLLEDKGYTKIGLFGSSFGGITAIITASRTPDLLMLALKSPVSNYLERELEKKSPTQLDEWKNYGHTYYINNDGKKFKLNYTFFEDFPNNDGYEAAKKIKIPTLIVHGGKDESVPIKQSKKTATLIENCALEVIPGSDHNYSNPEDFEKMLDLVSQFIIDQA